MASSFNPISWQAGNSALNCSYNDVLTLERKLGKLGVQVTDITVLPQGINAGLSGAVTTEAKDILAQGAKPTDELFYQVAVADLPNAWNTAALLLADLVGSADGVAKVMADLYGSSGQDVQARANQAMLWLPGVQGAVQAALAAL
jgi:hypothetical protein